MLLKLNSTEDVALLINSTNTSFDGFINGNVGKEAGHIKGAHVDIRVDVKILHGLSKGKQMQYAL